MKNARRRPFYKNIDLVTDKKNQLYSCWFRDPITIPIIRRHENFINVGNNGNSDWDIAVLELTEVKTIQ